MSSATALMSKPNPFDAFLDIHPRSLVWSEATACIAGEGDNLLVAERVAEARHRAMGRVLDPVQYHMEEVVRSIQMQIGVQAERRPRIKEQRSATGLMADSASSIEETR